MKREEELSIFKRPLWVSILAITAATLWGWAYPLIKLGFHEFQITSDMTGSKMLFAGIRFFISGLIILSVAKMGKRSFAVRKPTDWGFILLFTLMNTTLHYAFFYFGLSNSQGARAAILNSMSVFIVVIIAGVFFKSDRLSSNKILGCVLGIIGVLTLNLGSEASGRFTFLGDGMILLNAICGATASLMTPGLSRRIDIFVGTGYSLGIGGALLIITGIISNGTIPNISLIGIIILILLIEISTIGFALYNKLLSCNPVSKVAIYNSLIPVVGAITSCLFLSETFYWKYLLAGSLAAFGIYIINKDKK